MSLRNIKVSVPLFLAAAPGIPFTEERLPNGLTVIYHEDHRLPLVTVNTWYHVGSKDERPGRSGFAHLFEHLMFMGTERIPGGRFDEIIEAAGGSNNASTSQDRTNYYDQGPANLLPALLYLEADRMEGFGRAIDRSKLDTQRGVVRNERRQSYENRPYGKALLAKWELLYPPGHPYREPVIGSHQDLENATVEDVRGFFERFYVPANASLVVAGDFETEKTRALVREYFGKIPGGARAPAPAAVAAALPGEVRKTLADRVQLARVGFFYHSPAIFAEGDAELDIAGSILGEGKSSRLYRSLVYEKQLAQDVAAQQSSLLLGSLFEVMATARPGVELTALERALDEEIEKLAAAPPSAEEVERARNGYEVEFWQRIEALGDRADLLNSYQFHFGTPDGIERDLGRYRSVTPQSVTDWARKFLRQEARLVLAVVPEGKEARAKAVGAPEPEKRAGGPSAAPAAEAPAGGKGAAARREEVLPGKPPEPGQPKRFEPPVPTVLQLASGVPLWVLPARAVPLVDLILIVRGAGAAADLEGQNGLAALTASMLDEGAGQRGALEIADRLDLLGATLAPLAARERGEIRLSVLKRNLDPALDIFADVLLRPRFEPREWERVKALAVNDLTQRHDNPAAVSRVVVERRLFGDGHAYAAPLAGYAGTVRAIDLDAVREFHRGRWRPERAGVVVVGDVSPEEIRDRLEARLSGWTPRGSAAPLPAPPAFPAGPRPRLIAVDKPGAPQTVIAVGLEGLARSDPAYVDLLLANTFFGGAFTSRLSQNLRETHKFTYGASSNFHRHRGPGAFLIQTSVKTDVTGEALVEIARECRGMAAGPRAGEVEKAKANAENHAVESFSTLASSAEVLAAALDLGLPPDEPRRLLERVSRASPGEVAKAAARIARWEEATIVLVGDRKALETEIREAKLDLPPPVFADPDGN